MHVARGVREIGPHACLGLAFRADVAAAATAASESARPPSLPRGKAITVLKLRWR